MVKKKKSDKVHFHEKTNPEMIDFVGKKIKTNTFFKFAFNFIYFYKT